MIKVLVGFIVVALPAFLLAQESKPVIVTDGKQPQVTVAGETIHLTFGRENEIFYSTSADGGKTFAAPVRVAPATLGKTPLGMRRGPRVAVANDAIVITAIYAKIGGGKDGDVLAFRSTDGGKTWSEGDVVNDVEGAAREGLHHLAGGDGKLFVTWLDLRAGSTQLYGALSKDGGATWSADTQIYTSPGGTICECCHPSAAIEGDLIAVMFRNSLSGNRDMYLTQSRDGGQTFSPAEKLGVGSWPLNGCPMDGGFLAITDRKILTAWRRDSAIYTASPGANETKIDEGRQPWLAVGSAGPVVVYVDKKQLKLHHGGAKPFIVASDAADPIAAPLGASYVLAWESNGKVVALVLNPAAWKP